MNFVVDASVAIKWYVPEIYSAEAGRLLAPPNALFAPDLFLLEFGNIVWKKARRREFTESQARKIVQRVQTAQVKTFPHDYLLPAALTVLF